MIPVSEAVKIVLANTAPLPVESIALTDTMGRILSEDIVADTDLPPFDRAQMDGYAVRAEDGGAIELGHFLDYAEGPRQNPSWFRTLITVSTEMPGSAVPATSDSMGLSTWY